MALSFAHSCVMVLSARFTFSRRTRERERENRGEHLSPKQGDTVVVRGYNYLGCKLVDM